jgi:hypothetical protein
VPNALPRCEHDDVIYCTESNLSSTSLAL